MAKRGFLEDVEVIRSVKGGDTAAFSILVEKYHAHLLNFIFSLVRDEDIVEDIGQEVFLSIYKSLRGFDENRGTPFSAWLFAAARNRCVTELRKTKGRKRISTDEISSLRAGGKAAEESLMEKEQWLAINRALQEIPEPFKSTILRSLHGSTIDEIAKKDRISLGTAKSRLFRARKKVKLLVREYFGEKGYEEV